MKYCSNCGEPVVKRIPPGDHLPRYVCEHCHTIHYQNPKIVAGCIPEWEDSILLCRRAIQPRYGLWTVPAGFMENAETTEQAAARETMEEAYADVEITSLYAVFSLPYINQVYMLFRGRLHRPEFRSSPESLEVQLFRENEVPWETLAFKVIHETLQRYFQDRARNCFQLHVGSLEAPPNWPPRSR